VAAALATAPTRWPSARAARCSSAAAAAGYQLELGLRHCRVQPRRRPAEGSALRRARQGIRRRECGGRSPQREGVRHRDKLGRERYRGRLRHRCLQRPHRRPLWVARHNGLANCGDSATGWQRAAAEYSSRGPAQGLRQVTTTRPSPTTADLADQAVSSGHCGRRSRRPFPRKSARLARRPEWCSTARSRRFDDRLAAPSLLRTCDTTLLARVDSSILGVGCWQRAALPGWPRRWRSASPAEPTGRLTARSQLPCHRRRRRSRPNAARHRMGARVQTHLTCD
jgi:hypothetical protein